LKQKQKKKKILKVPLVLYTDAWKELYGEEMSREKMSGEEIGEEKMVRERIESGKQRRRRYGPGRTDPKSFFYFNL
jgi:hypothetical protein